MIGLLIGLQLVPVVFAAPAGAPVAPGATLDIGNRRQVFIDRQFLASARDVMLAPHPPRKTGERTVVPDRPWERNDLGCYSCVLKVISAVIHCTAGDATSGTTVC